MSSDAVAKVAALLHYVLVTEMDFFACLHVDIMVLTARMWTVVFPMFL